MSLLFVSDFSAATVTPPTLPKGKKDKDRNKITNKDRNMKRLMSLALMLMTLVICQAQTPADWERLKGDINFYMCNDMGRNGYYQQKPIAALMGEMAETIDPECVFAIGDVHHFYGVESVDDPLWMTNYELIYSHPDLMLPWYPVLGNHEYRGNTQAVLDYAKKSRRWMMEGRYYTKVFDSDGTTIRFVLIDTTPLINRYRTDSKYPEAGKQDMDRELAWIDSVLSVAKEDWVVVMGHHPIYSFTEKNESERTDMQKRVDTILRKHKVDVYACGHIHNFQHIRKPGCNIDYVINSAAALSRPAKTTDGTVYCSGKEGFCVISVTKDALCFHMIDKDGNLLHTVKHTK